MGKRRKTTTKPRLSKKRMMQLREMYGSGKLGPDKMKKLEEMYGSGIIDWIKGAANTVYDKVLKPVGNWVKDNKIISKVFSLAGNLDPRFKAGAIAADAVGLGRKRRTRKKPQQKGDGFLDFFESPNTRMMRQAAEMGNKILHMTEEAKKPENQRKFAQAANKLSGLALEYLDRKHPTNQTGSGAVRF
jgi:hypothetical protein